ncbi:MAG TPA: hypothetical protein VEU77_06800 [Candidatus Acidoferrales bacterium]|nr:hypothetical protein [Candidatus Acidoferrales bacterium]
MNLMLSMIFLFVLVGLIARRFGPRQQLLVTLVALALAAAQYTFPRFL